MKKLKNNKGMTGVDIVVSVTLIVITLGIVIAVYSSNMNKTKEVKRTSTATNLAMKVIETIENADIMALQKIFITDESTDPVTEDKIKISNSELKYESYTNSIVEENFKNIFGIEKSNVDKGYTITIGKVNSTDAILQNIAFQVDVTVSYNIGNETKKVTLSTIKKYDEVGEAEAPGDVNLYGTNSLKVKINEDGEKEYEIDYQYWKGDKTVIPIKYDSTKNGYVKTDINDSEWYSISSKVFPLVVNVEGATFDRNGVLDLAAATLYIWQPSYYITSEGYIAFLMPTQSLDTANRTIKGKQILYTKNSEKISKYSLGKDEITSEVDGYGRWRSVGNEYKSNPNTKIEYYNELFTWGNNE